MAYVKLEITRIRSGTYAMQMQEFEFYDIDNVKIQPKSVSSSLTPYSGEGIENLIDGNSNTKFCTTQWGGSATGLCVITFTFDNFSDVERIHHYRYMTGNDLNERDPVSWKLSKSEDGATYEEVISVEKASILTGRKQYTENFNFFVFLYWYIEDGKLNSLYFPSLPENTLKEPMPPAMWSLDNNELSNGLFVSLPPIFKEPFPLSMWTFEDNKLYNPYPVDMPSRTITQPMSPSIWHKDPIYGVLNDLLPNDFLTIKLMWYIKDGKPTNDLFPEISDATIAPIYPLSIWYLDDNDKPINSLLYKAKYSVNPVPEDDPEVYEDTNISNYDNIINKPSINGIEINEEISLDNLGIKEMPDNMIFELLSETFNVIL